MAHQSDHRQTKDLLYLNVLMYGCQLTFPEFRPLLFRDAEVLVVNASIGEDEPDVLCPAPGVEIDQLVARWHGLLSGNYNYFRPCIAWKMVATWYLRWRMLCHQIFRGKESIFELFGSTFGNFVLFRLPKRYEEIFVVSFVFKPYL